VDLWVGGFQMSSVAVHVVPREGTRERRRRANRRRIAETAIARFERRGFSATTVDEIAASCDIGRRTFFRYFQSKEELLYPFLEESRAMTATVLDQQGPEVRPAAAMRTALLYVAEEFQRDARFHRRVSAVAIEQHHEGRPLADSSRPVLSDLAQRQTEVDLAAHMGVDPVIDPTPGLVSGALITAFASAYNEWISPSGATDLPELVRDRVCRLQRVLAELGG